MPIQVKWENDQKTIISWTFQAQWTAQELRQTIEKSNDFINAQDHSVNHIIDLSQSEGLPPYIFSESRNAMRQMPHNVEHVVIITKGGIIESVGTMLKRFSWFSNKVHIVLSIAEAQVYLLEHVADRSS